MQKYNLDDVTNLRVELKRLNPWWLTKTINSWSPRKVVAVYYSVIRETEDTAFSRYANAALKYDNLEFQAEIMEVFNNRF